MVLTPLDRVEESIPGGVVVRDPLEGLHNPVSLPWVLHQEHAKKELKEGSEIQKVYFNFVKNDQIYCMASDYQIY